MDLSPHNRMSKAYRLNFSFIACSIEPFLSDQTAIWTTHFPYLSQNVSGIQIAVLKELGVTLYGEDSPHNPSRKAFPLGEYRLAVLYLLATYFGIIFGIVAYLIG